MADVPENQKIEKVLATRFNAEFANIAVDLCPALSSVVRLPQRVITLEPDAKKFFGLTAVPSISPSQLSQHQMGREDTVILDFGVHMVGYLSLDMIAQGLNIDAPCRLRLTFGESLLDVSEGMDNVKTWISTSWLPDEIINIDYFPEHIALPRRYSCRYIKIDVIDTSPKYTISIDKVTFEAVSSVDPNQSIQKLDYGDDLLNQIDYVSIATLRECMQTVFEDGPRRDRRLWIGDLRLQALTNYCTFKDFGLAKRCIFMFAALIREDGSLPACLFEKPQLSPATDYIVDYDALFAVIVHEYIEASGDMETGKQLWPTVTSCLKRAIDHVNPGNSLFEPQRGSGWKFLDWKQDLDRQAGLHGLLIVCLKAADKLAASLQLVPQFNGLISAMVTASNAFFDTHDRILVSGPNKQISLASAAWLVLAEVFSPDVARDCLKNALVSPERIEPETPYLWHYVCEAMVSVGLFDESIDLLKKYWGGMILAGADTFWECFDQSNPRLSPYGDVRNNSFCHAWSCTPSFLLRTKLTEHLTPKRWNCTMDDLDQAWIASATGSE